MKCTSRFIRTALLALVLSSIFVMGAAAASLGSGTVTATALRLRAEPSTSSNILATASAGSQVVVLGDTGDGWYKVDYNTIEGYMYGDHLNVITSCEVNMGYAYIDTGSSALNLRDGAGTNYNKLASIPGSSIVPVCGISDGWYKVTYGDQVGYISSSYVQLVQDADGTRADGSSVFVYTGLGSEIVAYAQNFLGCPYVYGASGPSRFDCSGFTSYIYAHFGYTLNRSATDQLSNGTAVSRSDLQPGDLVFFKYNTSKAVSHVGIYIGDNKFIHASTTGYTVRISDMSSGHYYSVFVYGRRVV